MLFKIASSTVLLLHAALDVHSRILNTDELFCNMVFYLVILCAFTKKDHFHPVRCRGQKGVSQRSVSPVF